MLCPNADANRSIALYLDLMKRCLTDAIYIDDSLSSCVEYRLNAYTPRWRRAAFYLLSSLLAKYKITLAQSVAPVNTEELEKWRERGLDFPARAFTMIGLQRLDNLQFCVETAIRDGVPGDLIETGVWRGGACIFMRAILKAYGDTKRQVWVADSFAGLPRPNEAEYEADRGATLSSIVRNTFDFLAVPRERVTKNFKRCGLLDDQVQFIEGWFKDTLPAAPINSLAVMRLDGDMYESTIQALEALYPKLSPGGFVIIDDYFLKPCAQAVHDFRGRNAVNDPIHDIDGMASYWRRER
jgi:O-methyltransferase